MHRFYHFFNELLSKISGIAVDHIGNDRINKLGNNYIDVYLLYDCVEYKIRGKSVRFTYNPIIFTSNE